MEALNGAVVEPMSCFRSGVREVRRSRWVCGGFEDKGHLDYYTVSGMGMGKGKSNEGWNGVSTKKRIKLLKGLTQDLETFSSLGFGDKGLVVEGQDGMFVSRAAEVLLAQLKQLRAEEEQLKKKEKQEKQKSRTEDSESSSSSESSESSDGECDEVVDVKRLKDSALVQPVETKELPQPCSHLPPNSGQESSNMILDAALNDYATIEVLNLETPSLKQPNAGSNGSSLVAPPQGKRIEVCMGGKCKKSGGPALMQEFRRVVGDEGAVVGCKCMGKCKSGPNVRVMNGENVGDDSVSVRNPSNPLYIGVGLGDVDLIVANYFGKDGKELGLVVPAWTS